MKPHTNRILIVDDNEMNRDMLARRLARKGYDVLVANGAHDLVESIKQDGVDLVLLDIEMPEITGLDALRILRKVYSAAELPVIMVTAKNQSEDIITALDLGANDYLTKPIDFPVAVARITTQLAHKRAQEALKESEERYALAALGSNDGLWDWNIPENEVHFSARWKSMLGFQENEISNKPEEWFDRIHDADRARVKNEIAAHQNGTTPHFESEHRMLHHDGTFRWMLSRGLAIRDQSGRPLRMAGSQTDITQAKVSDPLTGLPNRLLFIDRLNRLIKYSKRRKNHSFAVVFMDLDGFKMINDSMGHMVGDQLLVGVAERLEKCLRATDTLARLRDTYTVARLGGDEFTVLLDDLKDPNDAKIAADRLMKALKPPFLLAGKEVYTSVSIGIAQSNPVYEGPDEMLRDADTAMYHAKSLGKGRYEVFDAKMRASVMARLQLETDLRHALERREFRNYYQPIVNLASGEIAGFEALLRWQHPTRGLLGPIEFIGVVEETGLIRELGWWNLSEACRQIGEWRAACPANANLIISVNLSAKQFLQPNLVADIANLLRDIKLPPDALKLEITESTVMKDPSGAVEMLQQIKSLGVRLAIDDFGTGYSSLSYLHRFPLDTLKIDRSFISSMDDDGDGMEIARTILPMAKNLRLDVVAEGVETSEQFELLKKYNCAFGQGYYFSRPLSADGISTLLKGDLAWQGFVQTK
ncbi:MAG TPA: EAL domain-containing protein [Verrucomicrobiae bacterium]|jgi:diguanylate cyclase (GGDEF)-like protein/PAS domain S-box-containing protein|nr:EAL domain-containing protein [Verrucomicrobiae bacterium]